MAQVRRPARLSQSPQAVNGKSSQLTFTKPFSAQTFKARLGEALARLSRIQYLRAPFLVKKRLIRMGVFAAVFFSPSMHFYSEESLDKLTTATVNALGMDGHSRSVPLSLLLAGCELDPRFHVYKNRILSFKRMAARRCDAVLCLWNENSAQPQGPMRLFLAAVEYL